ncbi:MAG: DUF1189 family protein [Alphaproteobacteria bacterium]|nr:DUF1189 family protein [Alphaproteobacteria bacterium]
MNSIKTIYNSFFNFNAGKKYIKESSNSGMGLLALSSLIVSLLFSLTIFLAIYPIMSGDKVERIISESFQKLPRIIIADGELVWEDNVKQRFVIDNGIHLIVDTQSSNPNIDEIKKSALYLTKTDLYVYNASNYKLQVFPLEKIQQVSGMNPLDLTSAEMQSFMASFLKAFFWIFISSFFLFGILYYWLICLAFAVVARWALRLIYKPFKEIKTEEMRRTIALAMIPSFLTLSVLQNLFSWPDSLFKWLIIAMITAALSILYHFEKAESQENKALEDKQ